MGLPDPADTYGSTGDDERLLWPSHQQGYRTCWWRLLCVSQKATSTSYPGKCGGQDWGPGPGMVTWMGDLLKAILKELFWRQSKEIKHINKSDLQLAEQDINLYFVSGKTCGSLVVYWDERKRSVSVSPSPCQHRIVTSSKGAWPFRFQMSNKCVAF